MSVASTAATLERLYGRRNRGAPTGTKTNCRSRAQGIVMSGKPSLGPVFGVSGLGYGVGVYGRFWRIRVGLEWLLWILSFFLPFSTTAH